jgi:ABC-type sugar transport system ATPase subunit
MNDGQKSLELERIRLDGLSRRLGERFGIADVSFAVNAGEILGLIGHTGAGKTTLLRLIAGLDPPDAGHVFLNDQPANAIEPHRRGVAMVFQRDVFYPGRTLEKDRREAEKAGVFDRWKAAGIPAEFVFEELEFDEALFRQAPETLSGGQGRRASLLRAMLRDTPILLADEPLAGLDLWTRDRVARLLWRFVKATGKAAVVVAHEPVEAMGLADRLAVLDQGRLVQIGTAEELRDRPEHREVIRLLRYPPWNDVTGLLKAGEQSLNPGETCLVDPAACRVVSAMPPDGIGVEVRLLRRRPTSAGTIWELVERTTGRVFRTFGEDETQAEGILVWEAGSEVRFGLDGFRMTGPP